jgi:hypothetical protein
MKNALWYLGFLSLVSLLYFVDGKVAFLGFLGFISYFSLYKMSDEMFEMFVGKATRNAFMYSMFFGVSAIVYIYLTGGQELLGIAFVFLFGGSLLVCVLSMLYYFVMGR